MKYHRISSEFPVLPSSVIQPGLSASPPSSTNLIMNEVVLKSMLFKNQNKRDTCRFCFYSTLLRPLHSRKCITKNTEHNVEEKTKCQYSQQFQMTPKIHKVLKLWTNFGIIARYKINMQNNCSFT